MAAKSAADAEQGHIYDDEEEPPTWKNRGFSPYEAREWETAGFNPDEAAAWADVDSTPNGYPPASLLPGEATAWAEEGFDPDAAGFWFGFDEWSSDRAAVRRALQLEDDIPNHRIG